MSQTKRRSKASARRRPSRAGRPQARRRAGMSFACVVVITATAGAAFAAAGPVMALLRNGGSVAVSAKP